MQTLTCLKCAFRVMAIDGMPRCILPGHETPLPHLLTSLDVSRERCVHPDKQVVIDGAMWKAQQYEEKVKQCADTAELAMNTQAEALAGGAR